MIGNRVDLSRVIADWSVAVRKMLTDGELWHYLSDMGTATMKKARGRGKAGVIKALKRAAHEFGNLTSFHPSRQRRVQPLTAATAFRRDWERLGGDMRRAVIKVREREETPS